MSKDIVTYKVGESRVVYSYTELFDNYGIVSSVRDMEQIFRKIISPGDIAYKEHMVVLLMDRRNALISYSIIGVGTTTAVLVDQNSLFANAIIQRASSIILIHNHPSGNLKMSREDKKVMADAQFGAMLFGMTLLDFMIVTRDSYFSAASEGDLALQEITTKKIFNELYGKVN